VLCGVTALSSIPLIRAGGPVVERWGLGAVMGRHHGWGQGRKLSVRSHLIVPESRVTVPVSAFKARMTETRQVSDVCCVILGWDLTGYGGTSRLLRRASVSQSILTAAGPTGFVGKLC
jgi:hypothetical protein